MTLENLLSKYELPELPHPSKRDNLTAYAWKVATGEKTEAEYRAYYDGYAYAVELTGKAVKEDADFYLFTAKEYAKTHGTAEA